MFDTWNPAVLNNQLEGLSKRVTGLKEEIETRVPDFSTEEINTGVKWIDGKDIYCRVFTGTFGVDNTPVVAGTISNYNKLVACFYNATNSFGNSTINVATSCYVTSAGGVTCVPSAAAFYEQAFNAIVYYTKPGPDTVNN